MDLCGPSFGRIFIVGILGQQFSTLKGFNDAVTIRERHKISKLPPRRRVLGETDCLYFPPKPTQCFPGQSGSSSSQCLRLLLRLLPRIIRRQVCLSFSALQLGHTCQSVFVSIGGIDTNNQYQLDSWDIIEDGNEEPWCYLFHELLTKELITGYTIFSS